MVVLIVLHVSLSSFCFIVGCWLFLLSIASLNCVFCLVCIDFVVTFLGLFVLMVYCLDLFGCLLARCTSLIVVGLVCDVLILFVADFGVL